MDDSCAVHVAAALIQYEQNRYLICKRGPGGNCGGLWEFPGGKVEPGETSGECLIRECREELDVEIELIKPRASFVYRYPDGLYRFSFFDAKILLGAPVLRVHTAMCWAPGHTLGDYTFCPADGDIVDELRRGFR